jgi:hypothetical protein
MYFREEKTGSVTLGKGGKKSRGPQNGQGVSGKTVEWLDRKGSIHWR